MSIESLIVTTLTGFVSGRVYPDIAPQGMTALPRITYQQVGGQGLNFLEAAPVGKKNGRFQINVWGATRLQVAALARQVEDALKSEKTLYTTILGAPIGIYEPDTKLYGAMQDFSFWW
jgi:hypothetical protein